MRSLLHPTSNSPRKPKLNVIRIATTTNALAGVQYSIPRPQPSCLIIRNQKRQR